jgi:hypothetical protein
MECIGLAQNPEERWKKWWRRMWTSLAMIFGAFGYLYATRTFGLVALIVGVQSLVYRELVQIQLNLNKERYDGFLCNWWARVFPRQILAFFAGSSLVSAGFTPTGLVLLCFSCTAAR